MSELFKCQECGTELQFSKGDTVCECIACGSKQVLPKNLDLRISKFYESAEKYRLVNMDFDRAKGLYQDIINEDDTDAEAHWSYLLCKYGIEYVDDPNGHGKKPTIHRIQRTPILDDEDYKAVIKNADDSQREVFEHKAGEIAAIQNKYLEISDKEQPYDIFICFKQTDENNKNTMDCVIAQQIYDKLTDNGYKVFFSKVTLREKLSMDFEPYIFAALMSAKVMIVVGTRPDYLESVWVRNEWARYLEHVDAGEDKRIIPVYDSMGPEELPRRMQGLQGEKWQLGSDDIILKNMDRIFDRKKKKEVLEGTEEDKLFNSYNRAKLAVDNKEWDEALNFAESALSFNSEYAPAYLVKLLAKCQSDSIDNIHTSQIDFGKLPEYSNYLKFADEAAKEKLQNKYYEWAYTNALDKYNSGELEKVKEAEELFATIEDYKDASEMVKNSHDKVEEIINETAYQAAMAKYNSKDKKEIKQAKKEFEKLGSYKDSAVMVKKCNGKTASGAVKNFIGTLVLIIILIFCGLLVLYAVKKFGENIENSKKILFGESTKTVDAQKDENFGEESLLLAEYEPYEKTRSFGKVSSEFAKERELENEILMVPSNEQAAFWNLDGLFGKLEFEYMPYNDNDSCKGTGELYVVNRDSGEILYKTQYNSETFPEKVTVDIAGIKQIGIIALKTDGKGASLVINNPVIIPGKSKVKAEKDFRINPVSLLEAKTYDEGLISRETAVQYNNFDKFWYNVLLFNCGNGNKEAYAVYELKGNYSTLSFDLLPYTYENYFGKKAAAEVKVINAETDEVLYTGKVNAGSEVQSVKADITNVKYLKITATVTKGDKAYCIISDPWVYDVKESLDEISE